MLVENDFVYNNEEEAEMAQLHSIHIHMNAVAEVQRKWAEQTKGASAEFCDDCDEEIPEARRKAIPGVRLCVFCKERSERA